MFPRLPLQGFTECWTSCECLGSGLTGDIGIFLPGFEGASSGCCYASVCSSEILAFVLGIAVQQVMWLWDAWGLLGMCCFTADQRVPEALNMLQGTCQPAACVGCSCIPSMPCIPNIFNAVAPVKPPRCSSILDKYWKSLIFGKTSTKFSGGKLQVGHDNPHICKP